MALPEDLVTLLKAACSTTSVYHLSVYQELDDDNAYPCIVYELTNDNPIEELDRNSGVWLAEYAIYILAFSSDILREWSNNINDLTGEYETGWLQVNDDIEQYNVPVEQQEKGVKQTTLKISIIREGK